MSRVGETVGEFGQQIDFDYFIRKGVWSQEDYSEFHEIMDGLDKGDTIVYGCRMWTQQEFKRYALQGRRVEKKR